MRNCLIFVPLIFTLFLAACGGSQPAAAPEAPTPATLQHVDVGVGFIPNVQFAPFYVAQEKGFFATEGLDVALEYGFENDFVALTAQGERQFAVAGGDQVILARSQGLPVVYVMKWYQRFPVGVAIPADRQVNSPPELAGHSVGIPGLYGASYVAWKALAYTTGLDEAAVELREIGFTQAEALSQGKVDAAVVYIVNEPVQLGRAGADLTVIEVSDYIDLVSNGLITNQTLIEQNPELVGRLVRGALRGLSYTIQNPDEAFEITRRFVPDMTDEDAPTQRAVLEAAIQLWRTDRPGLSDPQAWADSAAFMLNSGLIESAVEVDTLYTNQFVPE
ncbi:MAG: ABC transporter substrate-binding protein [Anaerolineae bacterium]